MTLTIHRPGAQLWRWSLNHRKYTTSTSQPPIIKLTNATFYRHHPNSTLSSPNPPLFPNLSLEIPSFPQTPDEAQYWAVIGRSSSGKTTLLKTLGGANVSIPPSARSWPWLEARGEGPRRAIRRVGFEGEEGRGRVGGAYLSARYESRRERGDWTVGQYLRGEMELNPFEGGVEKVDEQLLERVVRQLSLEALIGMNVMDLSNGQTRRARVAKALLGRPEVLLLDEPFAGLDPGSVEGLSGLLGGMARRGEPRIVLGLRIQDLIPEWVTHLVYLKRGGSCEVEFLGRKEEALERYRELGWRKVWLPNDVRNWRSTDGYPVFDHKKPGVGEALVEMEGAVVSYGSKTVLGNWKQEVNGSEKEGLWWNLRRGERWGVFGPNGSGKTTLLSLICSDHPKTYSLPIRLFGRSRSPEPGKPGVSIFDIQSRIGHSSPEIHSHIPLSLTIRQVLENAWADTFLGTPKFTPDAEEKIKAFLNWFRFSLQRPKPTLSDDPSSLPPSQKYHTPTWADQGLFGGLSFGAQKLLLFLRAIIKEPDIVILDEAFSGMDDTMRNHCLAFLSHGETKVSRRRFRGRGHRRGKRVCARQMVLEDSMRVTEGSSVVFEGLREHQALVVISHVKEEVPGCVREWICLPDAETGGVARVGRLEGPIEADERRWEEIWGVGEGSRGGIGGEH